MSNLPIIFRAILLLIIQQKKISKKLKSNILHTVEGYEEIDEIIKVLDIAAMQGDKDAKEMLTKFIKIDV